MNCEQAAQQGLAEKYILGQLNAADTERFEEHFFECDNCFEEVQTLCALREGLRELPAASVPAHKVPIGRPAQAWRWAAVVAIVLAVAGASRLWFVRSGSPARTDRERGSGSADARPQSTRIRLSELAGIDPPPFKPLHLRGAESKAAGQFRAAMASYSRGDYEAAIPLLLAASKADASHAGSRYFLGICLLMINQADSALKALQETVAMGDSPYLEEARFYLAKGYLRVDRTAAAKEELREVIAMHGDLEERARKLVEELQKLVPGGG